MNTCIRFCKLLLLLSVLLFLTSGYLVYEVTVHSESAFSSSGLHVDDGEYALRLMTFNIRHGRGMDDVVDLDRIAAVIENSGAQVIGLQEVDRFNVRSGFKDEVKLIAEKLNMNWCFVPSFSVGFSEYGNALLSRFPIISANWEPLPHGKEPRSMLTAELDWYGINLFVMNTHLGLKLTERIDQMEYTSFVLAKVEGPSVWMGDFNMEKSDPLLEQLFEWHSPSAEAPTAVGKEIDHIYMNRYLKSKKAKTIPTLASDHHPVIVDVILDSSSYP